MLLVVDNGSVYTSSLLDFLYNKKFDFKMKLSSRLELNELDNFDSFILTGRRQNEQKMNRINSQIILHVISEKKKLLGICYGSEILALTLGGTIKKSPSLIKGSETVMVNKKNPLIDGNLAVFQSHRYEISRLGEKLENLASSQTCKHEVIKHNELNIFGTQFHPEMTRDGKTLVESFVNLIH